MKINSRRFASQAVSLARRSPEARAESAAERRHGRACSDTAGRAERASMPTAGSLDLPSFGATVLTTGLEPGGSAAAAVCADHGQGHHARAAQARLCGT